MKDNRRGFIKKSASMAAAISVAGLGSCTNSGTPVPTAKSRPLCKRCRNQIHRVNGTEFSKGTFL